ncbi:MAG: precorrin-6A/cobalt-precorrin-6A reductase, partial [Clostridia bacterium]
MNKICVFAGTSEGRELCEFLANYNIDVTACVATEYGESLILDEKINVNSGRMDKEEMYNFFLKEKFDIVVDSTHPYAQIVTENIFEACSLSKTEYLRVNRNSFDFGDCTVLENTETA